MANIELPEEPFSDDKIVRLVGTNIFDFTTLVYGKDIRVADESTILKFFVNPEVKVMSINDKKVLSSKKLWKNSVPTANEFKQYLENPVTTLPYKGCIEAFPKAFDIFQDDYPFAIIDQILTKNPYGQEIESVIKLKKGDSTKKSLKEKKSSNIKMKIRKKKTK